MPRDSLDASVHPDLSGFPRLIRIVHGRKFPDRRAAAREQGARGARTVRVCLCVCVEGGLFIIARHFHAAAEFLSSFGRIMTGNALRSRIGSGLCSRAGSRGMGTGNASEGRDKYRTRSG